MRRSQLKPNEIKLVPFELREDFDTAVASVLDEVLTAIQLGRERHGDSFSETGLIGLANHCLRKARDQYHIIVEGKEVGDTLQGVNSDFVAYAVLARTFIKLAEKEGYLS
jgi:hypothetical protein